MVDHVHTIRQVHTTLPMHLVVSPLSDIRLPLRPNARPLSFQAIFNKISLISCPVAKHNFAFPMLFTLLVLPYLSLCRTIILRAIGLNFHSVSFLKVIHPVAVVLKFVGRDEHTFPVYLVAAPFSFVCVAVCVGKHAVAMRFVVDPSADISRPCKIVRTLPVRPPLLSLAPALSSHPLPLIVGLVLHFYAGQGHWFRGLQGRLDQYFIFDGDNLG